METPESVSWLNFNGDFRYPTFWPEINTDGSNPDQSATLFDQDQNGISIAQKQKFRIADLSPNWGYADEATKVNSFNTFFFLCCRVFILLHLNLFFHGFEMVAALKYLLLLVIFRDLLFV